MSFTVQVRRAAELEIAEAQLWYEAKDKSLGAEFLSQVSQTMNRILKMPLLYPIVHRDVRRALVRRFPYLVWYRVSAETVVILACSYAGRDPNRLTARLR